MPAVVKQHGLYDLISSACTGWLPNQGTYAYAAASPADGRRCIRSATRPPAIRSRLFCQSPFGDDFLSLYRRPLGSADEQKWLLGHTEDGYMRLRNAASGLYLAGNECGSGIIKRGIAPMRMCQDRTGEKKGTGSPSPLTRCVNAFSLRCGLHCSFIGKIEAPVYILGGLNIFRSKSRMDAGLKEELGKWRLTQRVR